MTPGGRAPIRLGVSACLLGENVRYDGGHKRDRFLTDVLADVVEWVPVCPELEAGLGVPRPPMRLVRGRGGVRLVEIDSGRDHTHALRRFSTRRIRALRKLDLSGYVLKEGSPSCGAARVRVYPARSGSPNRGGRGVFAAALLDAIPDLPVEEEGRLQDPPLRAAFIERVFAYRRLRDLFDGRPSDERILAFHTTHELQLMAHSRDACQALTRLVGRAGRIPRTKLRARYASAFMKALGRPASRAGCALALRHAATHSRSSLDSASQAELARLIRDYREGRSSLAIPATFLRDHATRLGDAYLVSQTFLSPDPAEQMLRDRA